MRRLAALLLGAALTAAASAALAEPLPEGYTEIPAEAAWEEPQPEPVPAAEVPAAVQPLQIVACWYEQDELYLGSRIEAQINYTVTGLVPGAAYSVEAVLRPVGSENEDKPEITGLDAFTASDQTQSMSLFIDMSDPEYAGVPYGMSFSIAGGSGQYTDYRQSVAPITVTEPKIKVSLTQQERQYEEEPVVLDAQTNVTDIEQGGDYTVRTSLIFADTKEPVRLNGAALEDEQTLEAPEGYLTTYAALASFTVPESLVLGRSLRAKVLLFRDGLQIGSGHTSVPFYLHDMEGKMPVVTPTKTPEEMDREFEAMSPEERQAVQEAEESAALMAEMEEQQIEQAEAQDTLNTVITLGVLGGILLAVWLWYRKQKKEGFYRH